MHEVSNALTVVLGWLSDARDLARTSDDAGASTAGPSTAGPSLAGDTPSAAARLLQDALAVAHEHARRAHVVARRAIGAQVDDDQGVRTAVAVAEDALLAVTHEAEVRGVELVLEGRSDVLVDAPDAVSRVLINLLLNALAFSPSGGTIHVALRLHEDEVRFRVRDGGPGVPAELRDGLFTSGVSKRQGGAGVGLLHCAELAREHGGALALVDDDPAAEGACFELSWRTADARSQVVPSRTPSVRPPPGSEPLSSVPPAPDCLSGDDGDERISVPPTVPSLSVPPEPSSTRVSFAGKRLLLLEDDDAVLDMVRFGLTARGADVQVATSASRLAELLDQGSHFDAALLDLSPLGAGAGQVLGRLARMAVPVILISGSVAPDILAPEREDGSEAAPFASWVHKPFALNELYDALVSLEA